MKLNDIKDGKVVDKIELGELMMDVVDFGSRLGYQGSLSAPPCSDKIYWNVVRAVYPIKKEVLAKFNQLLSPEYSSVEDVSALSKNIGNYRPAYPADKSHLAAFLTDRNLDLIDEKELSTSEKALLAVGLCVCSGLVVTACQARDCRGEWDAKDD